MHYKYLVATRCFTYNHAPYIEDALRGFAMQETSFPCVFIIVDDASTDGAQEVIRSWAKENLLYPKDEDQWRKMIYGQLLEAPLKRKPESTFVILLLTRNHHSPELRSLKFEYIRDWYDNAKYQALCEGDDYWVDSRKLEKQVFYLEKHPKVGMVYSKCKYYYQKNKKYSKRDWGGDFVSFEELITHNTVPTASVIYRQPLLKSYNDMIRPQERHWLLGDYSFWLFISRQSQIYFFDECFSVYRVLPESASHSSSFEKSDAFLRSLFDMKSFFCDFYNFDYELHDYLYKSLAKNAIKCKRRDKVIEYLRQINEKDARIKILEFLSQNPFTFMIVCFFLKA